jgi:hypothetical protein
LFFLHFMLRNFFLRSSFTFLYFFVSTACVFVLALSFPFSRLSPSIFRSVCIAVSVRISVS